MRVLRAYENLNPALLQGTGCAPVITYSFDELHVLS
jgi:hypothetical protein